jgi:hypothetical protein
VTGADQGPTGGQDPIGSAAEEAAKLLGALSGWAGDLGQHLGHGLDGHLDTGAPECTYCPICRGVHLIREVSPEVTTHLAHAATSLVQAAAGVFAAAAAAGAGSASASERSATVQDIDLDDPGDGDDAWDEGWNEGPEQGPDGDGEDER